jgi:lysophospholipase L1-like esterase
MPSKDRIYFLANKAVSGRTADDVLDNFDTDMSGYSPGWVSLFIGHNDFITRTSAQIVSDITSIYYKVRAKRARLLLITPYSNTTMSSESYRTALLGAIQGMRELARDNPDIVLVDAHAIIVDPTSSVGAAKTTLLYDTDHLNQIGALLVGKAAAKAIAPFIPAYSTTVSANSDIPGDATAKQGLLNPKCTGTGGTVGTGGSGTCATSWSMNRQSGSNMTIAGRKEKNQAVPWVASTAFAAGARIFPLTYTGYHYVCTTAGTSDSTEPTWGTTLFGTTTDNTATWTTIPIASDDEDKEWQFMDIASASGSNEMMRFQQSIALSSTDFAVGDTVFGRCEYKMLNARGLDFIRVQVEFLSSVPAVISSISDLADTTYTLGSYYLPEGVMRTQSAAIPSGTVTLRYTLNVQGDSPMALKLWTTNCEIRKV